MPYMHMQIVQLLQLLQLMDIHATLQVLLLQLMDIHATLQLMVICGITTTTCTNKYYYITSTYIYIMIIEVSQIAIFHLK